MEVKEKTVITVRETAKEYGIPEHGLRNLIKSGEVPTIKCGNRHYISRPQFENYLLRGSERKQGTNNSCNS
jgi:phage antirepressor YoqD-like protein